MIARAMARGASDCEARAYLREDWVRRERKGDVREGRAGHIKVDHIPRPGFRELDSGRGAQIDGHAQVGRCEFAEGNRPAEVARAALSRGRIEVERSKRWRSQRGRYSRANDRGHHRDECINSLHHTNPQNHRNSFRHSTKQGSRQFEIRLVFHVLILMAGKRRDRNVIIFHKGLICRLSDRRLTHCNYYDCDSL